MPITFEEISGEVVPDRATESTPPPEAPSPAQTPDLAELLRRELQHSRERQRRLIAD